MSWGQLVHTYEYYVCTSDSIGTAGQRLSRQSFNQPTNQPANQPSNPSSYRPEKATAHDASPRLPERSDPVSVD